MRLKLAFSLLFSFFNGFLLAICAQAQPMPGNPTANPESVVRVGDARFTILTDALVRLEYASMFDEQSMVIWNRRLPVPFFTVSVEETTFTWTITTKQLTLTYVADGEPFNENNLRITLNNPGLWESMRTWTPALNSASDPGNLFGTFHNLDTLSGMQSLNCSELNMLFNQEGAIPYYPCVMGLVSKSGWALVDDSRSPVFSATTTPDPRGAFPRPRLDGQCDPALMAAQRTPCNLGMWNMNTEATCIEAGCCWAPSTLTLNLYYSAARDDHFTDATCQGCDGSGYVFVRAQGDVYDAIDDAVGATVPLNLYWNPSPHATLVEESGPESSQSDRDNASTTAKNTHADGSTHARGRRGAGGSNVVSTFSPGPGYTFVRVQGYILNASAPLPPAPVVTSLVKLYQSPNRLDFITTMGPIDEQYALQRYYRFVAVLGRALAPTNHSTSLSCFTRRGNLDWYFLGHGRDYQGALRDYSLVAGPMPIPRRHFLGVSWSKWGNSLTQQVTYEQVVGLANASLPLDTYIFDMNWHLKPQWTGYTWDPVQYPDHVGLLSWLHTRGLQTGANLHDADGVMSFEKQYPAMAAAMGLDPDTKATVPFFISNKTFAAALQTAVLEPLAREGLDFWWTDFQQGLPGMQLLSGATPTMLLNHVRFMNYSGSARRGLIHSRFGGLGSHRYPTFFGGDVAVGNWDSLKFMIQFTATAANVLVGWWGHEMMRSGGGLGDNSEVFVRLMQFGAWSPVFTSWGNDGQNNNLWLMPPRDLQATQHALAMRARTLPVRYTLARVAFETGLSPVRPMYYGYPGELAAYNHAQQYLIGWDVLCAPVFTPMNASGVSSVTVWVPPGPPWLDFETGQTWYDSNATVVLTANLSQVPVLARAGSIIALREYNEAIAHGSASRPFINLEFNIYPGGLTGATWVYDDDGLSPAYETGAFTNTSVSYATSGTCKLVTLSVVGGFPGQSNMRGYAFHLFQATRTVRVMVDGAALPASPTDRVPSTYYVGPAGTSVYPSLRALTSSVQLEVCAD
eukprot:m.238166 g.238166  ORF g.238166 m.238166 type:complete len:1023 (+) comp21632_c0_seq1:109-3177(+)